eukprot:239417_1
MHRIDSKKMEDEEDAPWMDRVQKSQVLNEAKIFHQTPIDSNVCRQVIVEILFLLSQGEELTPTEATDVFFGCTKLFQSTNPNLRRLVYLVITCLNQEPGDALMVVSSLMKDVTGNNSPDLFRANAIRVLSKVIDSSLLGQIERYLKQSVVAKDPFIASAALAAGIRLYPGNEEVIRRWVNEVQEALNSSSKMAQFHALNLLQKIKQHDRGALAKVVTALTRQSSLKSPLAQCLLVRYTVQVIGTNEQPPRLLVDFLSQCLHHKHCMVMLEAARALCSLDQLPETVVSPAAVVLQEFLNSPVPSQRFAAVRTLSQLVTRLPYIVTPCHADLENLITDVNRNIATLAITTLLKTGVESSVERLMKSLTGFMTEVPDELKTIVVQAIRALCLKFPQKHESLMGFMSSVLREEGGFEYKKTIVDSIVILMEKIESSREKGLEHLCEFIEDCEFPELSVRILHLLGVEGPKTPNPAKYIRFIFNRVILELPSVRCAAVSSLAKFGAAIPSLAKDVCILLRRCLNDNDDEVRDRATYFLSILEEGTDTAAEILSAELGVNFTDLEYSLELYLEGDTTKPFTLEDVVPSQREEPEAGEVEEETVEEAVSEKAAEEAVDMELLSIPEFAEIGQKFSSTKRVDLTETESEYLVQCIKHVFPRHVVLQFRVTNTIDDQILENVRVELEDSDEWAEEVNVAAAVLEYNVPGNAYVCLARPEESYSSDSLSATLKFTAKDSSSGDLDYQEGIEDEFQLEDVSLRVGDFARGAQCGLNEFKARWGALAHNESVARYSYDVDELQEVLDDIVPILGLSPIDGNTWVPPDSSKFALNLSGEFSPAAADLEDGNECLAMARIIVKKNEKRGGVGLQIAVRSTMEFLPAMLTQAVGDRD